MQASLTIEGIRIVLDSGLMRVPRFDVRSGMSRLATISISQQSTQQRRGRASRLEPGLCIRCWSEPTQRTLALRTPPEILDADLTSLALELAGWGIQDATELFWLDPPPAGALTQARHLLQALGALDTKGHITEHGRKMIDLPILPRLAHMVLQGSAMQVGGLACDLAGVLNERNLFTRSSAEKQADLRIQMEEYYRQIPRPNCPGVIKRISQSSQIWQQALGSKPQSGNQKHPLDHLGILLALAYPDRIAQQQSDGSRRYKLANGRLAKFYQPDPLEHEEYLVIADLDGTQPVAHIHLATPIDRDDLFTYFSSCIQTKDIVEWDEEKESVLAHKEQQMGELILEKSRLHQPDPELIVAALLKGIRSKGLPCLPWTKTLRQWQARVQFLQRMLGPDTEWPDLTKNALFKTLEHWLGPYLTGISSFTQLKQVDLTWPLHAHLTNEQRQAIETLAPTHLTVPTGSRIALDYQSGEIPILAVRLQEMFGMTDTPTVANGKVPILIHLLSPARRPVQVTQDLKSFWKTGYPEVKKELKGRYPKHAWPDNPLEAPPTRGIKKR